LSQDEINTLNQLIIALTEYATTTLWKTDTTIILISLLVFIKRKLNNFPSAEEVFEDCKEQLDLRSFIEIIELELYARYGIRLDGQEKRYICDILQSTQLIHNLRKSMGEGRSLEESSLIDNFSEDFIDAFSTITDINLRKKPNFITRIKDHIRPMIKRVQIGLGIVDEHLEDYAQEYLSTLNVCEIICWILTKNMLYLSSLVQKCSS
jgi:PRD domain.